jgi:hypothetical protein
LEEDEEEVPVWETPSSPEYKVVPELFVGPEYFPVSNVRNLGDSEALLEIFLGDSSPEDALLEIFGSRTGEGEARDKGGMRRGPRSE